MRKSRGKIAFLALFITFLVSLGFAQQPTKIGVINSQEVLQESTDGKEVMARMQEKDNSNQTKLTKLDEEIRQLETKLNTQRLTLTQESIIQLTSDLERKRTERKRFAEDSLRELQELRFRLFNKVQNEVLPIIEQIGKERNLDIIFDLTNSGAVYFSSTIDITAEVIKKYDASKAKEK